MLANTIMGNLDAMPPPDNSFRDGDPRFIDIDSALERQYWCKALGISEEQLRMLVESFGPSAQTVKDCLQKIRAGEGPDGPAGG